MKTFTKCADVLKVVFEEQSLKYRREKLKKVIDRYVELHEPYASLNTCFI